MAEMLFTVKETAKILKCNTEYVHRLRKAGLIRFMKLGSFKVRKSELERFLEECENKDLTDPFNVKDLTYSNDQKGVITMANTDYIKVPYLDYMTVVEKACKYEAIKKIYESTESYYVEDATRSIIGVPKNREESPAMKVDYGYAE